MSKAQLSGFIRVYSELLFASDLSANDLRVLQCLLIHCCGKNYTFVGQESIAKETFMSPRSVSKMIHNLEEADYIRVRRKKKSGNRYYMNWEKPELARLKPGPTVDAFYGRVDSLAA